MAGMKTKNDCNKKTWTHAGSERMASTSTAIRIAFASILTIVLILFPISLRDREIPLPAGHTATDRISDPFGDRRQREAPVEAKAVATEVRPGVLVEVEGVERSAETRFEVPEQHVDPAELREIVGVLTTRDDGLMAAACRAHGAEAGQAIGEHCAAGSQVLSGPGAYRL
jgi:hypothetical protein